MLGLGLGCYIQPQTLRMMSHLKVQQLYMGTQYKIHKLGLIWCADSMAGVRVRLRVRVSDRDNKAMRLILLSNTGYLRSKLTLHSPSCSS